MHKPKIAVLIDWYLPGTKAGGPVRSVYSLINLLKNVFDFYIITTNTDLGTTEPYKNIEPDNLYNNGGINYYYFSHNNLNSEIFLELFEKIKPDLIYLNSFWSFNFSINIILLKNKKLIKPPVLLAPRGMLGKGALSLKSVKKKGFLALAKLFGWYKSIPFHATQVQEEQDILSKFKFAKVFIAPNINSGSVIKNRSVKIEGRVKLFYLSRIAKVKNLHYALEILKDIPNEYQVEYDIYGNPEDVEYWATCQKIIEQLPKNITINYKGELQFDQVQEIICNYQCLFLPTLNENFGHSIVESLLCGCIAIISDQTPWNDLEENGAGFAIDLNNKQKYVDSITSCAILNQDEFSTKSERAINYISKKIDLQIIGQQYKNLFNDRIKN